MEDCETKTESGKPKHSPINQVICCLLLSMTTILGILKLLFIFWQAHESD
jgi:hypothetical protein